MLKLVVRYLYNNCVLVQTQRIHCSSQRDERHTSPLALLTDETIQAKMEELSNSADNVTGGGITR